MIKSHTIKRTINDKSDILYSIHNGDIDTFKSLVSHVKGIAISQSTTNSGETFLHWATAAGQIDICRHILSIYPDAIYVMTDDEEPAIFHTAYRNSKNPALFKLLYTHDTVNHVNNYGSTMLHILVDNKELDIPFFKLVLSKMTPEFVNAVTKYNDSILHIAAKKGHIEACRLLLHNIDRKTIEAKNYDNKTALDLTTSPIIKQMIKTFLAGNTDDPILATPYEETMCALF